MSIKAFILAAATLTSVALPSVASARQCGGYGYSHGYYRKGDRGYDYRDERARERWERHRWQERRRFEEAQRRHWAREHRRDGDYGYRY